MKSETRNFTVTTDIHIWSTEIWYKHFLTVLKGNCDPEISLLFLQVLLFLRENEAVSGDDIADNNNISTGQGDPVVELFINMPAVKEIQQYMKAHKLWYFTSI